MSRQGHFEVDFNQSEVSRVSFKAVNTDYLDVMATFSIHIQININIKYPNNNIKLPSEYSYEQINGYHPGDESMAQWWEIVKTHWKIVQNG